MEMSVFELKTWAAFLKLENKREKQAADKMKNNARRR
jgi:hypothetical protein